MLYKYTLQTGNRDQLLEITGQVRKALQQAQVKNGAVVIYCPHTTAGITINENADPNVGRDLFMRLEEVYPWKHPRYLHGEGNSAAHLKAATIGVSQAVPVADGELILGVWQGIYFCEFDGPRKRTYYIKIIKD